MLAYFIVFILVVAIIIVAMRQQKHNQKMEKEKMKQQKIKSEDEIFVHGEEVKGNDIKIDNREEGPN